MQNLVSCLSKIKVPTSFYLLRTFLEGGKHVCVEYPMTINYSAAVELWNSAKEKGDPNTLPDSSEKCF